MHIIGLLLFFAAVFVLVLAFPSRRKRTRVRKIDPATGRETIEIHETVRPGAAQKLARAATSTIGIIILLTIILVMAALR